MVADALLSWFRASQRPLPWRVPTRDPYRVWVSEVMLQQTRVETVLRYHDAFLARFPDVTTLAAASEDDVMKHWEGLGYYRRARLLHAGAKHIVAKLDGHFPTRYEDLLTLPGFGPYTAGAVASLSWGEPVPAVDGNVLRVASRILALDEDVARPPARRAVEAWVRAHQPATHAGAFNEALMELGATVCTPKSPTCGSCPLAAACVAQARGEVARYPIKSKARTPREMRVALAVVRRGAKLLLEKRTSGLLAGTWGLPWVEVEEGEDAADALAAHVARLTGAAVRVSPEPTATGAHVFTHRRWTMEAYDVDAEGPAGEWRAPESVALGTAHRRILAAIEGAP